MTTPDAPEPSQPEEAVPGAPTRFDNTRARFIANYLDGDNPQDVFDLDELIEMEGR